jgi:transcriptional regulator with XRE-family HTH domain
MAIAFSGCSFGRQAQPMGSSVPRKKPTPPPETHFGQRLAQLRQEAGLSQRALEKLSGVSHRMIAYYEGRDSLPPGHVLAALAKTLQVGVDDLLAPKTPKKRGTAAASRPLLRRLQQLEQLPLRDKRELLSIIDTYLERHRLLQKAS